MQTTLDEVNIENLKSLWRSMAGGVGAFMPGEVFDICYSPKYDWPQHLWFNDKPAAATLEMAIDALKRRHMKGVVPIFESGHNYISENEMRQSGFDLKSRQYGMVLDLNGKPWRSNHLRLQLVDDLAEAKRWEISFFKSFAYHIHADLLISPRTDVHSYLAFANDDLVGVLMTNAVDSDTIGIHSFGVLPSEQRKGYGKLIMQQILHQAGEQGYSHATLQSSEAGRGLYESLGFEHQFLMKNYILEKRQSMIS